MAPDRSTCPGVGVGFESGPVRPCAQRRNPPSPSPRRKRTPRRDRGDRHAPRLGQVSGLAVTSPGIRGASPHRLPSKSPVAGSRGDPWWGFRPLTVAGPRRLFTDFPAPKGLFDPPDQAGCFRRSSPQTRGGAKMRLRGGSCQGRLDLKPTTALPPRPSHTHGVGETGASPVRSRHCEWEAVVGRPLGQSPGKVNDRAGTFECPYPRVRISAQALQLIRVDTDGAHDRK